MSEINNKYIRKDCKSGFINDQDEIEYFKAVQNIEIVSNLLQGEYNENGVYILPEETVENLINIPKYVTSTYTNLLFCECVYKINEKGPEKFLVKYEIDDNNNTITAILQFLETCKKVNGKIVNTVATEIARYTDINNDMFNAKMYNEFNIVESAEYEPKDFEKYKKNTINIRKKYLNSLNVLCKTGLIDAEKNAFESKYNLLVKSGEKGKNSLINFESRLKHSPEIVENKDYKSLNELLDAVIDNHKTELTDYKPAINRIGAVYGNEVQNVVMKSNLKLENMQKNSNGRKIVRLQEEIISATKICKNSYVKEIVSQDVINKNFLKDIIKNQEVTKKNTGEIDIKSSKEINVERFLSDIVDKNEIKIKKDTSINNLKDIKEDKPTKDIKDDKNNDNTKTDKNKKDVKEVKDTTKKSVTSRESTNITTNKDKKENDNNSKQEIDKNKNVINNDKKDKPVNAENKVSQEKNINTDNTHKNEKNKDSNSEISKENINDEDQITDSLVSQIAKRMKSNNTSSHTYKINSDLNKVDKEYVKSGIDKINPISMSNKIKIENEASQNMSAMIEKAIGEQNQSMKVLNNIKEDEMDK